MKIFTEVTIAETGIVEQIDKVKNIGDKLEDEILKLREMLTTGQAKGATVEETAAREEKIEINTVTATCVSRHIQAYLNQSSRNELAHFGTPCAGCSYAATCKFDWYAKMKPILDKADINFQLCISENQN